MIKIRKAFKSKKIIFLNRPESLLKKYLVLTKY